MHTPAWFLIAVLAGGSASAASPKLAMPGLTLVKVDKAKGEFLSDYLAQKIVENGVPVTTASDVANVLDFERQKQLMGCSDGASSSCIAEIAGGLGVDGLVLGSLARVGKGYTITVKIVAANDGRTVGAYSTRVNSEDELLDWMAPTGKTIADQVRQAFAPKPKVPTPALEPTPAIATASEPIKLKQLWWIPAAAGGALLAGGGTFVGLAHLEANKLRNRAESPLLTPEDIDATVRIGTTYEQVGWTMAGVGLAGLGTAAAFYFWPDGSGTPGSVTAYPTGGGGATVSIQGVFP